MENQTEQLTPQELALVLGCEAEFEYKTSKIEHKLTAYYLDIMETLPDKIRSVKPFLRKPEDITEEEAKHIYLYILKVETANEVKEYIACRKKQNSNYKWSYKDYLFEGMDEIYQTTIKQLLGNIEVIDYLTRCYIDLRGWIEQGKALHKLQ